MCNFKVELLFRREDGGFFGFLNAHIETMGEVGDHFKGNAVWKIRGEKAVDLRYHISISGKYKCYLSSCVCAVTLIMSKE
jgi:hypothetical protein